MQMQSRAYAPATVANLGPGFDILGLAVDGAGDVVTVTRADDNRIQIRQITGDDGQLPINPNANTAAIAAKATPAKERTRGAVYHLLCPQRR